MIRAFHSEWAKFLRPGQLLGSWGTMVGFGILVALLLVGNAGTPPPPPAECTAMPLDQAACSEAIAQQRQDRGGPAIDVAYIEADSGGVFAFQATGQLLGIIGLVIAAANLATEYTSGTLKGLLVREPRRSVLFTGKILALWSFILVGIAMTFVGSVGASALVAAVRGIDASAWWTGAGWSDMGQAFANATAGAFVWALMGTMLAVLFRSGFPAIGVGIAYPLVVEGLLGLVSEDLVKWMPGSVLGRLASGSTAEALQSAATVSYGNAVLLALAYAVVFAAVSIVLLVRRDVT